MIDTLREQWRSPHPYQLRGVLAQTIEVSKDSLPTVRKKHSVRDFFEVQSREAQSASLKRTERLDTAGISRDPKGTRGKAS